MCKRLVDFFMECLVDYCDYYPGVESESYFKNSVLNCLTRYGCTMELLDTTYRRVTQNIFGTKGFID